ncbi:DUF3265 domain-containing protein [Vibrio vulnificus]|nr:DUF3265 domain-containing protein [Vibrio vulnificus]EIU7865220.1 DUF3265 domain-containing protein [Vibrio vulnificus]EJE8581640.1 DUF3265 domain-containing protein [Vibrio vulnificus]
MKLKHNKAFKRDLHAWHFQFALGLVVKVLCGHFCIACLRPLTRRYALIERDGRDR